MSKIRLLLPWSGLLLAVLLWQLGTLALTTPIAHTFAPAEAFQALRQLLTQEQFWHHLLISLKRVGIGLLIALLI